MPWRDPYLKKQGRYWDDVPDPTFTLDDCSEKALRLFVQNATRCGEMDETVLHDSRIAILDKLELLEGRFLKHAACLLFSDRPERYVSGAWIKIGFFVTDDDLRYQDEIHGNLFDQVDATLEMLRTKYSQEYTRYDGTRRSKRVLFPFRALREAVLNAVVHKDYSSGVPIQISVYRHQIVLWNSGRVPPGWTAENPIGQSSCPPNPLLANAFLRSGYIGIWGRGIVTIYRECCNRGLPLPTFDFSMSGLMLTFKANPGELAFATGVPFVFPQ
jgi:ATP-dependent DNA helicase RecG